LFLSDIHVREPEGDVLIFMTGQVMLNSALPFCFDD
jgi:HrpA-like RNA helicase